LLFQHAAQHANPFPTNDGAIIHALKVHILGGRLFLLSTRQKHDQLVFFCLLTVSAAPTTIRGAAVYPATTVHRSTPRCWDSNHQAARQQSRPFCQPCFQEVKESSLHNNESRSLATNLLQRSRGTRHHLTFIITNRGAQMSISGKSLWI
jgi:hypothetical protein